MPASTSAAATSSWVESGFEAHKETCAPPAFSVSARFAVSVVTCRHAEMRIPSSGLSFAKRALIWASTGMLRAAHSILLWPLSASLGFLTSPLLPRLLLDNLLRPAAAETDTCVDMVFLPFIRRCLRSSAAPD